MSEIGYYHLCSNGRSAGNFIQNEKDLRAAFNIAGVCAANCNVKVVTCVVEETHLHSLQYGSYGDCLEYARLFDTTYTHYAVSTRGRLDFRLDFEAYQIKDKDYLMNVGVYTLIQPTKDGQGILPFDYKWGTGSLYFRRNQPLTIWHYDNGGNALPALRFGDFGAREKKRIVHSRTLSIPDDWIICNGLILPTNYVNTDLFERIYGTHNCYRVFLGNSRKKDDPIDLRMAEIYGIEVSDLEARKIYSQMAEELFGSRSTRALDTQQKLLLGQKIRREANLSHRQIAILTNIQESEIKRYIK